MVSFLVTTLSSPIYWFSAGFGLGALNDAEDDDIDVYDRGASKEHRRMAYDAGENEDDDRIALGSSGPAGRARESVGLE